MSLVLCFYFLCVCGGGLAFGADANGLVPANKPAGAVAEAIPLWADAAPNAKGTEATDIPALIPYLLKPASDGKPRAAVIICPGGGYGSWHWIPEGDYYARWLNEQGIDAFVLRYRLGTKGYRHPDMLNDAARAVRTVRANADKFGIDPDRIGIMGSSAGGHLAASILTLFDAGNPAASDPVERVSSKPNLGLLLYPVITMQPPYVHMGSRKNLLGEHPTDAELELLSAEKQVTKDTAPTFLVHSRGDPIVKPLNSFRFAEALDANGVLYELHVYDVAGHGYGLGPKGKWRPAERFPWVAECERWLNQMGFAVANE